MRFLFLLTFLFGVSQVPSVAQITGTWYGQQQAGDSTHFILDIRRNADGLYAMLDLPEKGLLRMNADSISYEKKRLYADFKGLQFRFEGKAKKTEIKGELKLEGETSSFVWKNTPIPPRTQWETKKPPYEAEEVRFKNEKVGFSLAGTLTFPKGKGKFPAVVLITGSGPQNRDEEVLGHKPFQVLADYLTRQGVAVLRYDDRGVAESEGEFRPATLRDYADDAAAAVDFLATHPRINTAKIGLLGHSEGGNIAPLLAAERRDIAFLVLLAAPGVSNLEMNLLQLEYIYQDEDPKNFDRDVPHWRKIYKAMAGIADRKQLRDSLTVLFDDYEAAIKNDEEFAPFGGRESFKKASVERHSSLWYHDFLRFNGQDYLKKLQIPILALNGTRDRQVDAEQNLTAMEKLFKENGNMSFKALRIEGTSHFIQHCKTCNLLEMYFLPETFSQKALDEIGAWLREEKVL